MRSKSNSCQHHSCTCSLAYSVLKLIDGVDTVSILRCRLSLVNVFQVFIIRRGWLFWVDVKNWGRVLKCLCKWGWWCDRSGKKSPARHPNFVHAKNSVTSASRYCRNSDRMWWFFISKMGSIITWRRVYISV